MKELHYAGWLLIGGWILFWIGAFSPPYRQWTSPLKEYLEIAGTHRWNWYWIHTCFVIGVLLTVAGCQLLDTALYQSGERMFSRLGSSSYFFGALLWIASIAFRVTVDLSAGKMTVETGVMPAWIEPLHQWSGLLFAVYMMLAYLSIASFGQSLLSTAVIAGWVAWMCVIFGIAGAIGFIVRFPLFAPPLMVHLPLGVLGIYLVRT
ncbi:MAG TPA: hypothetical protein VI704_07295 [Bacteroidota bacterium]|nr:hypothetical protein [Bacteroidota bacterium]